ncbi:MAG: RnfABCDGE type electron transport complex subunit B [Quisquiliibacterium sp.]
MPKSLTQKIDAILPQTQCQRCGFEACLPYAKAIADGLAPINRCPPGGQRGVEQLAALAGLPVIALDPDCGEPGPHRKALVIEQDCIGCTKCIVACPVDAIIGAPKRMHTVIAELCSGCELCVPACPVDCIQMQEDSTFPQWTFSDMQRARDRYRARGQRLERERELERLRLERKAISKPASVEENPASDSQRKRALIQAAIRKARDQLAKDRAQ